MRIRDWISDVCSSDLVKAGLGPHLALNVHDEVICDVPNEDLDEAIHTIYNVMNDDQLFYGVDLTASVDVGERWGDKMSVEEPTRILSSGRHAVRSEERRVGKECVRTCRSRWSP